MQKQIKNIFIFLRDNIDLLLGTLALFLIWFWTYKFMIGVLFGLIIMAKLLIRPPPMLYLVLEKMCIKVQLNEDIEHAQHQDNSIKVKYRK